MATPDNVQKINTTANPAFVRLTGASAAQYATFAAFPDASTVDGMFAIDQSQDFLYIAYKGGWRFMLALI